MPQSPPATAAAPLAIIGCWAWYSLPVAAVVAGIALWSASRAPSEESTRLLHEQHAAEWHYIQTMTGR